MAGHYSAAAGCSYSSSMNEVFIKVDDKKYVAARPLLKQQLLSVIIIALIYYYYDKR